MYPETNTSVVVFHKTTVINPTHYVDLVTVDNQLRTFLMHKIEDPNVFGVLKHELGDTMATIGKNVDVPTE